MPPPLYRLNTQATSWHQQSSDDGDVVVGRAGSEAFVWTPQSNVRPLANPPVFGASAITPDGSTVVGGQLSGIIYAGTSYGYRWTEAGGTEFLPGTMSAKDISADGSVIVGELWGLNADERAFRWTSAGGIEPLGPEQGMQAGSLYSSSAAGVSQDGAVIVGYNEWWVQPRPNTMLRAQAFRWEESQMIELGTLGTLGPQTASAWSPVSYYPTQSYARGISGNGSVIVGASTNTNGVEAFKWTAEHGMVGLGGFSGLDNGIIWSEAIAASGDGGVIVGWSDRPALLPDPYEGGSYLGDTWEAAVWIRGGEIQSLAELLIARGATGLDGWQLYAASGVSTDGRWIVGYGRDPAGNTASFRADLTPAPVPIPAVGWLLGSALGVLGWMRRRAAA